MMWPEYSLKINIHYVQKISFYNLFYHKPNWFSVTSEKRVLKLVPSNKYLNEQNNTFKAKKKNWEF